MYCSRKISVNCGGCGVMVWSAFKPNRWRGLTISKIYDSLDIIKHAPVVSVVFVLFSRCLYYKITMKVPYIVLSLGASALFLWQCSQVLNQDSKTLMHDILNDCKNTSSFSNQIDQALVHDKKYGYFLQITDTHVSVYALETHQMLTCTLTAGRSLHWRRYSEIRLPCYTQKAHAFQA